MASNFQKNIDEILKRLDDDETDVKKITNATHNVLMAMSVRDAICIINEKKKNGEILSEDEEIKLVSELVTKSYEEKLDFIKKEFDKLIIYFSSFF